MNITFLLFLFSAHFIGDFPFQSRWMCENKGKSWEINAFHSFVYTATIFLITAMGGFLLPLWMLAIILISHFIIEPLKSRWKIIQRIWVDQVLHLMILFIMALLF